MSPEVSPNAVVAWLRRWWWIVAAFVCFIVVCSWLAHGADVNAKERRAGRERIEGLAMDIKALAADIATTTEKINAATSPEAKARGDATLAFAIAELRRSIDCVAFYLNDERPSACTEVAARMDAIRAGGDPFPKPPTPGGSS